MKLNRVEKKSDQDYPIFDDYWKNRRKYVSEAALCAGVAISVATLTSCTNNEPQIMGDMVAPQTPAAGAQGNPPQPPGEMVAPAKPEPPPPRPMGKMKPPEKPDATPMPETPMIDGGMPAPAPPANPEKAPPRLGGAMPAPKVPADSKEKVPALKGDIPAPAPPAPKPDSTDPEEK